MFTEQFMFVFVMLQSHKYATWLFNVSPKTAFEQNLPAENKSDKNQHLPHES